MSRERNPERASAIIAVRADDGGDIEAKELLSYMAQMCTEFKALALGCERPRTASLVDALIRQLDNDLDEERNGMNSQRDWKRVAS